MIELTLSPASAQRLRFAISPLEEALGAGEILLGSRSHPSYLPWLSGAAGTARELPVRELLAVLSGRTYITDFLSPPPDGPETTAEAQLELVRRTPPGQVAAELALVDADLRTLPGDPAAARDLLADQLELVWSELVAEHWPRMRRVLAADIDYRSRRFAEGGLALVLADLHPRVRLTEGNPSTVLVGSRSRTRARLDRRGLLLLPSVFAWPGVGAVLNPPWQPCLLYPARGVAELWSPNPAAAPALVGVLGRTRAALLTVLDQPAGTLALAERLGLSKATVSANLRALLAAGLLRTSRHGHEVRYQRTEVGEALLRP